MGMSIMNDCKTLNLLFPQLEIVEIMSLCYFFSFKLYAFVCMHMIIRLWSLGFFVSCSFFFFVSWVLCILF